jgi:hypothetical protein
MPENLYSSTKQVIIEIDPKIITTMCTTGSSIGEFSFERCVSGLPKGAKFLRVFWDQYKQCIALVYEHESFKELDLETIIPTLPVLMQVIPKKE